MKAVLDVTRLLRRSGQSTPTGIDRVELAYARHLLDHYPGESSFIGRMRSRSWYLNPQSVHHFVDTLTVRWNLSDALVTRKELGEVEAFLGCAPGTFAATPSPAVRRSALPNILPSLQTLLSPINLLPEVFRRRPQHSSVYLNVSHEGLNTHANIDRLMKVQRLRPVYLVHDLIPLTHPEYVRPGDAEKHEARMRTVLGSASATVFNSRHTRDMLAGFADRNRMRMPPGIVSALGIEDKFGSHTIEPLECEPFFLTLGTIEPRKNHLILLHAWRALVEEMGEKAPKLVIVGRRGWENENVIDIIERCRSLGGHVLECNRLPDAHLRRLMVSARAVLFPSFAEGYGLPLFEALALRVPVICSKLDVFQDIAGEIPCYLNPIDGLGWARVVADYARPDSAKRQAQLERLARFRVPRWADHFATVDDLIAEIAVPERMSGPSHIPRPPSIPSLARRSAFSAAGERAMEHGSAVAVAVRPHSTRM